MLLPSIEKTYGKGSIMKLGDGVINPIESIPTGALSLDYALGLAEFRAEELLKFTGLNQAVKLLCVYILLPKHKKPAGLQLLSMLSMHLMLTMQKGLVLILKICFFLSLILASRLWKLLIHLVRSNALDVIVIDSVAALVPRSEIEGEMGDATMAVQARLMSQALRKLTGAISKSKTSVIFINQLRSKIGVYFGNPETTTGGNALKFYASLRLDIRRIAAIKDGTDIIGNRTKVKIVKSKVAPPFKEVEFDILYNEGISKTGDLLDLAVNFGIVKKGGAWFTFEEDRFQGREQFRQKLVEDAVLFEKISKEVKTKLGILPAEKENGKEEAVEKEKSSAKEKKSK